MNALVGTALAVAGSVLALYIVFLFIVSLVSVLPPRVPLLLSPSQLGEPEESVEMTTTDGHKVRGWWTQGEGDWVVVCAHGYLANRCEMVPYGPRLRQMGASLLFFDFRCHGGSDRAKCTFGLDEIRDLTAAVQYAKGRVPGARVVVFGSSMGGACAVRARAMDPALAHALVLDAPYANLAEAARGFWYVTGFKSLAKIMAPVSSVAKLWTGINAREVDLAPLCEKLTDCPTLVLLGTRDTVVPLASARRCWERPGLPASLVLFEGSGHAQARYVEAERYFREIQSFLEESGFSGPSR